MIKERDLKNTSLPQLYKHQTQRFAQESIKDRAINSAKREAVNNEKIIKRSSHCHKPTPDPHPP